MKRGTNQAASELRVIWQVGLADFRERTRRYPFLVAVIVCAWLCYTVYADITQVTLGTAYGYFNSAWTAATLAIIASTSLSLMGFFLVKNTIERDEQTRTGQLLAATSLANRDHLLGKWLSNFMLLGALAMVFLLAVPVVQHHRGVGYPFRPFAMLGAFLPMVLPAIAFVGALAVLWECIPLLKRGLGNVIYVIAWMTIVIRGGMSENPTSDLLGYSVFMGSAHATETAQGIAVGPNSFELNIGHMESDHVGRFLWDGFHWNLASALFRLEWIALGVVVCLIAVSFFKRFDPDFVASLSPSWWQSVSARFKSKPSTGQAQESKWTSAALPQFFFDRYSPLYGHLQHFQFLQVLGAELRLMLRSVPRWVYAGMAIANLVPLVAPHSQKMNLLPLVWLVPVLLWSQMGTREQRNSTAAMIFSSPHSLLRQLPALWAAGVVVALLSAIGMIGRALITGDVHLLASCLTGALFIPSMALAFGVWSNTPRLFEAFFVGFWYLGVNGAPFADFMGLTPLSSPMQFLIFGALLLGAALLRRWWDVERGAAQRALARVTSSR
jgi:hypothetical protein